MKLARTMGEWLEKNEHLADSPVADVALVYDQRAMNEEELFQHNIFEWVSTFHRLTMHLCRNHRLFGVVYASPWMPLFPERIDKYKTIILCDAYLLPEGDREAIKDWISSGGHCVTVSRRHSDFHQLQHFDSPDGQGIIKLLRERRQIVDTDGSEEIGFTVHKIQEGYALHLINYRMDEEYGKVTELDEIRFQLMFAPEELEVIPFGKSGVKAQMKGCELTVTNLGLYTIIKLVTGQEFNFPGEIMFR